jgi:demethylmenaquinone methyltransferase/2-methoxy-6-polyprenyl-1,4-benzoquinol methylase
MFGAIAPRYDFLNHALSFGFDYRWRRRTAKALQLRPGAVVLDLATGTGDMIIQLARHAPRKIVGADPTLPMLERCVKKLAHQMGSGMVELVHTAAEQLPFDDDAFDGATITFGIRNFSDRPAALAELRRVLRPGARLAICELSTPRLKWFADLYRFYFHTVIPLLGGLIAGNMNAYRYLPDSVAKFPPPREFCAMMRDAGFDNVIARPLTLGVAMLYVGQKC